LEHFRGKVIYVVGGSSGIGLSIAQLLARRGAHISIFARNPARLEKAIETISQHGNSERQRFSCFQMDVSDSTNVEKVFAESVVDIGAPEILINCAGRAYPKRFEDIDYAQFDETMKINMYGIWNTVSALLPHLKKTGGYIVNVSSIAGFIGVYGFTDYSASKFAIIGFSEALRSELKPFNIKVSVLCPPDTDTPAFEIENRTKPKETMEISKNAKLMQPDEVAEALLKGMRREKFIIIPGFDGKFTFLAKRWFPSLVTTIMDRIIARVQKR
jgi:short-subunit dehydrogenase